MDRNPPADIRRQLAREVGFGCPVSRCGSPYLTWHHFDPPWAVRKHHDPAGMVALCRDHHPEADAGVFTVDELREFKRSGRDRRRLLGARFNWRREELLAIVGGSFYYRTPIAVRVNDIPVVWFNRDDSGHVLVNLQMLTTSGEPRLLMLDNFWMTEGADEHEIECPPSGRLVSAKYPNGDTLKVAFRNVESLEQLDQRFPIRTSRALQRRYEKLGWPPPTPGATHADAVRMSGVTFPIATVEIAMEIAGTGLSFSPRRTAIGTNQLIGGWISNCGVGVQIGVPAGGPGGRERPAT
jgi:hypothetical protein